MKRPGEDPRVAAGAEGNYLDGRYYDHVYRRRRTDVRFYADVAEEHGGPVLELGVGTGRVARELARRGIEVVGVDLVPEMLEQAEARLAKEPRRVRDKLTLMQGDLTEVRLDRRFPLVIAPFNVFMHLYERTEWEQALRTVGAHLEEGGTLVFDVLMPYPAELARDPDKVYRCRPITHTSDGRRYRYGESFEYDPVTQIELITMTFDRENEPESFFITPLSQRQVYPAELEALLHYNGFTTIERYGDFDRSPFGRESESQIIVAQMRG